ncbi:lipid-A-disaccharide synthase [Sneathiella chinensis]|uniref:Lipid-A-disaccharide synthase n=1 Tax=Sneathiella chinensis TaxID=349750 RepID=A0ABQ5U7R0_9PROT|nr:lipid-A-disaccharide synthase [Sneathiella chinensis]GLQ07210.1 lipid-A-disaccharide synthase [Sneathiella chinensis]
MTAPLSVYLIAGEPSGDALAARLMAGLKDRLGEKGVVFKGVGGPLMQAEGLTSLFPMEDLTVMGLMEVLPKLPLLIKRINQAARDALAAKPDVFITVDAPDFSFRVAKKLKDAPFPKVHYVAPSVWAWRPGRAKKIAALYDHLLTLLPFEPPYFEKEGLPATFIGHSVIETGADAGEGDRFRAQHDIGKDERVLMVLPGSRRGEVERHLPVFRETLSRLHDLMGDFVVVTPVVGKAADLVRAELADWPWKTIIIDGVQEKYDAMAGADAALAASGTVGLELALARLPAVIGYRMNGLTAWIARRVVKTPYVNLVNILEKQEVVPELLLEDCTAENLSAALADLYRDETLRQQQVAGYEHAVQALGYGGEKPGHRAADVILTLTDR